MILAITALAIAMPFIWLFGGWALVIVPALIGVFLLVLWRDSKGPTLRELERDEELANLKSHMLHFKR